MKYKSWIACVMIFSISGLALLAVMVISIDPFFHYHGPVQKFPYQVDNQLSQNPGMAEHMKYDSVLLGSSMSVNFETKWFAELMNLNTLKLSYNGAYPRDIRNIMEKVDESGQPLKHVFLCVDLASWTGKTDETKYPIPEYLYNKNLLDDVNYWYNKGILLDYIMKPVLMRDKPTDLSHVYSFEEQMEGCYGLEHVLENYEIPEKNEATFPDDMFIEDLQNNLDENILPIIEQHEDTEFTVFFPPYSVLYWYEYLQNNQMEAVICEYRYAMEKLLAYDNVEIFYFPDIPDIVCDFDRYLDVGHYDTKVNRYMAECFADGEHKVTEKNYENELLQMKSVIETYDYDALFMESE